MDGKNTAKAYLRSAVPTCLLQQWGLSIPLYVTPKIYRPATNETQEFLVLAGSALFPHTGIFQQGLAEWEHIKNAYREAAKKLR
jgi:hypothetical protein